MLLVVDLMCNCLRKPSHVNIFHDMDAKSQWLDNFPISYFTLNHFVVNMRISVTLQITFLKHLKMDQNLYAILDGFAETVTYV